MAKKVAIMCDSSADISVEEANELGIYVLRMPIIIDGEEYLEGLSINDQDIYEALKQGKKVTTTQPSIGEMITMWQELLETHDEVFYLPLSKHLSGTCMNAMGMAEQEEFKGKVTVVESEFVCYPLVYILKHVKDMLDRGYTTLQIKEIIEKETNLFAILIPENLTTLKNGGRISPAAAKLAGMLKIQPLLKVEHGAIDVQDKVRTLHKAYKKGIEVVTKDIDVDDYQWMIIHAFNEETAKELQKDLEDTIQQPIEIHEFKAVILSHTGEGTIGFGRIKKLQY